MTIKSIGKALVITSSIKMEELKLLKKADPNALTRTDKDGNELYKIAIGPASFSKYGISFDSTDKDGNAEATIIIPENVPSNKRAEWIKDNYSAAIIAFLANEDFYSQAASNLKDAMETAMKNVQIL